MPGPKLIYMVYRLRMRGGLHTQHIGSDIFCAYLKQRGTTPSANFTERRSQLQALWTYLGMPGEIADWTMEELS